MASVDALAAAHALVVAGCDVIHLHHVEASFVAPFLRLRFPLVITAHGRPYAVDKWPGPARSMLRLMERLFVGTADICTAVSRPHAQECQRRYGVVVRYIPNGVEVTDSSEISATSDRARALLSNSIRYIAFAADRILPLKGCHFLLEAFQNVREKIDLAIIGNLDVVPSYGAQIRRAAAEHPRIRLVPFIADHAELMAVLARAELFVFPSTTEGMSMMLLEAASVGVPILCSDIADNVAVLGDAGFYFKSGDSADLAQKLNHALGAPKQLREKAVCAQQRIRREFSWERVARDYDQAYLDAIAHASARRRTGARRPAAGRSQ
jgi:glycosyltransferase involved in cell wall biosynthesis